MSESITPSRRQVLGATVAIVALPVLAKLTHEPSAEAADATENWITGAKVADLKDGGFLAVDGKPIVLARSGKTIIALSTICTHKGCAVSPVKTRDGVLKCRCHGAEYDVSGDVTKAPAKEPLPRYGIRIKDGTIEVNTAAKMAGDDKAASVTVE